MLYTLGGRAPTLGQDVWIADNATVIGSVILRDRASVWFNCVLRGDMDDLVIGEDSNIQDCSMLHTDAGIKLVVGRGCTIGHQVVLHGCEIGDNTLVGIGSIVLNGAKIGRNSIVGAGSLVPEGKEFPDGVLIIGSPAVVKRELRPGDMRMMEYGAKHYVQNARRYREQLRVMTPT